MVIPAGSRVRPELQRTWDESAHHIDLARRRGEEAPPRDVLFRSPQEIDARALSRLRHAATVVPRTAASDGDAVAFPIRAPEPIARDMRAAAAPRARRHCPRVILCDNAGQAERLDELLERGAGRTPRRALAIGVLDGGFVVARGQAARPHRPRDLPPRSPPAARAASYGTGARARARSARSSPATTWCTSSTASASTAASSASSSREQTIEVAVIEYEGGDRLNVPALPHRPDRALSRRPATWATTCPPPRLHRLGGKRWAQQREKTRAAIFEMTQELLELYARRKIAARAAARTPTAPGSGSSRARSCSRTRPTSARPPTT